MGYTVGIDLGTTYTAAAVMSGAQPHVIHLGNRAAAIPSVVFLHDGTMLTGEAAVRRGVTNLRGLAGEVMQKFVNYQRQVVILGDLAEAVAASDALRDFVRESNRGRSVWFVADRAELEAKLARP